MPQDQPGPNKCSQLAVQSSKGDAQTENPGQVQRLKRPRPGPENTAIASKNEKVKISLHVAYNDENDEWICKRKLKIIEGPNITNDDVSKAWSELSKQEFEYPASLKDRFEGQDRIRPGKVRRIDGKRTI